MLCLNTVLRNLQTSKQHADQISLTELQIIVNFKKFFFKKHSQTQNSNKIKKVEWQMRYFTQLSKPVSSLYKSIMAFAYVSSCGTLYFRTHPLHYLQSSPGWYFQLMFSSASQRQPHLFLRLWHVNWVTGRSCRFSALKVRKANSFFESNHNQKNECLAQIN